MYNNTFLLIESLYTETILSRESIIKSYDIGWYVYLWETEHNKADNYDPKSIAARSFIQTLRYESNENNFMEGDHFMISSQSMNKFLTDIGFNKISFGLEGSISFKDKPMNSQPLSINKYKGLNCINEVVAFK